MECGFELVNLKPIDGIKGTKSEIPFLHSDLQWLYDYCGKSITIRSFRFLMTNFLALFAGHMMLLIFRRSIINK